MAKVDLPFLTFTRAKGKLYVYYRRGGLRLPLPSKTDPAFPAAYAKAQETFEANQKQGSRPGTVPGSMAALISAYRASPEWRDLAPATRADYNKALNPLEERFGKLTIATMPRQFVFRLRDEYATKPAMTRTKPPLPILDANGKPVILDTPRRANRIVDVLRLLMSWAENRGGWFKGPNPVLRPGRLRVKTEGYRVWSSAEVDAFFSSADVPEPLKRAAAVGLYTGQRKQDCLAMTRADRAGGWINVAQQKTGAKLTIPEHPDLAHFLDLAPPPADGVDRLLTRADGLPWQEDHFNHVFAKAIRAAGLKGLSFHGLRKAASAGMAEHGASDAEIDSVLGHTDPRMTRHYRKQADQKRLAAAAIGRVPTRLSAKPI